MMATDTRRDDSEDMRRNESGEFDDPGTRDFWFGVIGLGTIALLAIVLALVS